MTIFGKIDLWSDQGCRAAIAVIFNSIWRILHSDGVLTGYQVKPSSVNWGLLARNEVGLFQIFNHVLKLLKNTEITISQKTPFFKITKK